MASGRIIFWMVDAQTTLLAADEDGWLVGDNTSNGRTSKTVLFVDAVNFWTSSHLTRGVKGVVTIRLAPISIEKRTTN